MTFQVRPAYIREAYRLLQQSIIFVDMEDVELDTDEVGMADPADDNEDDEGMGGSQGGGSGAAFPDQDRDDMDGGAVGSIDDATELEPQLTKKRAADAMQPGPATEPEGDVKRPKKEKKAKTQLPYHEYRTMTQFIAIHLRQEVMCCLDKIRIFAEYCYIFNAGGKRGC